MPGTAELICREGASEADVESGLFVLNAVSLDSGMEETLLAEPRLVRWVVQGVWELGRDAGVMSRGVRAFSVAAVWARQGFRRLLAEVTKEQEIYQILGRVLGALGETVLDARIRALGVEIMAGLVDVVGEEAEHRAQLLALVGDPAVRRSLRAASGSQWPWYQDAAVCVQARAPLFVSSVLLLFLFSFFSSPFFPPPPLGFWDPGREPLTSLSFSGEAWGCSPFLTVGLALVYASATPCPQVKRKSTRVPRNPASRCLPSSPPPPPSPPCTRRGRCASRTPRWWRSSPRSSSPPSGAGRGGGRGEREGVARAVSEHARAWAILSQTEKASRLPRVL